MNLSALVLHNVGPTMFFGYDSEKSTLYHAHEFQVVADSGEEAVNLVWTLTNVGSENELRLTHPHLAFYGPQVSAYRGRMNRSLSVGDVLVVHEIGVGEPRFVTTLALLPVGHELFFEIPKYESGSNETLVSESYLAHMEFGKQINNP
jgi:hypothetical protein